MEMVQQAATYLIKTFVFRIGMFLRHWYIDGFFALYGVWLRFLRFYERRVAIRINVRFLFQPLYQEYNIIGYVLGFLYRFIKVVIGGFLYMVTGIVCFIMYVVWAAIPLVLIYKIISGN
jgi:hypothetical protein